MNQLDKRLGYCELDRVVPEGRIRTWGDLAAAIRQMPVERLTEPVRFLEPYDSDPELLQASYLNRKHSGHDDSALKSVAVDQYFLS